MKQLLITFAFVALGGNALWAAAAAKPANSPFHDDLACLDQTFSGLEALESLLEAQPTTTYSHLAEQQHPLLQHLEADTDVAKTILSTSAPEDERLLGVPGFCWGCCFGLLGVVLVYVAVEGEAKEKQGRQAMLGCAAWVIVWLAAWLLLGWASAWEFY